MPENCAVQVPNGAVGCKKYIDRATHVALFRLTNGFDSLVLAGNINSWRVMLQETLTAFIFKKVSNFENRTSDAGSVEPDISKVEIFVDTPPPKYTFYLQSNFCDYKDVLGTIGINANYLVAYFLNDGQIMLVDGLDGSIDGFGSLVSAITKGSVKEIENSFPMFVNHTNYADFVNAVLIDPEWTVDDLLAYVPAGANLRATGAYDTVAGTITVQLNDRCGLGITGETDDTNFAIAPFPRTNVSTPVITSVAPISGVDGGYTFTLDKDAVPASLEVGDQFVFQYKVVASSIVTKISNWLPVIVKN